MNASWHNVEDALGTRCSDASGLKTESRIIHLLSPDQESPGATESHTCSVRYAIGNAS
jgi:hypothetical protein